MVSLRFGQGFLTKNLFSPFREGTICLWLGEDGHEKNGIGANARFGVVDLVYGWNAIC
jgi:hypothetical protein